MISFNWTEEALQAQYAVAKKNGWLPFFLSAASAYDFIPTQLLGLASRESGPFWSAHPMGDIVGDRGAAWGPLQIHIKFHPDRENYTTVEANILRGAKILAGYRAQIARKIMDYPDPIDPETVEVMIYASFNRGVVGMWQSFRDHGDPDLVTAHGNYGKDTQARAMIFAACVSRDTKIVLAV